MHILALLVAVLGAIGVILWRLRAAADATREIVDAANDAQNFFRRRNWQKRAAGLGLSGIDDAREAAVAMMVSLAQADGAMTERERAAIIFGIVKYMGATSAQAEEFLSYARWLVKDTSDPAACFRSLAPVVRRTCTSAQIDELLTMLKSVADAEGPAAAAELDAIAGLKRALR